MRYHTVDLEHAERAFREDIWSCAPEDAVVEAGVQARWFGPILATTFVDLPDAPGMNLIQGAAEPGAVERRHLSEAVEWMRDFEVDYLVPVAAERPESRQAELWLDWHGCEQSVVIRKYVRRVSKLRWRDAAGVEVRQLPQMEDEGLGIVTAEGLGTPELSEILFMGLPARAGWSCYAAYLEGAEVACGSMRIEDGIAMLGLDATLHHARGRGCNSALLRRRLDDAADAGCHTAVAVCPDDPARGRSPASRNLRRAGFAEAYGSVVWRPPVTISVAW
jgi:GNAT superfamily N-acetyltransferase